MRFDTVLELIREHDLVANLPEDHPTKKREREYSNQLPSKYRIRLNSDYGMDQISADPILYLDEDWLPNRDPDSEMETRIADEGFEAIAWYRSYH